MILDGLRVPFKAIDITLRGNEEHKNFMRENAINKRCSGVPLPPQFFDGNTYLGVCICYLKNYNNSLVIFSSNKFLKSSLTKGFTFYLWSLR